MKPALRISIAAAIGVLLALLTVAALMIETKPILMVLVMPGLYGAIVVSGNVHDFSLGAAAAINGVIYFVLGWLLCPLWDRLRKLWQQ